MTSISENLAQLNLSIRAMEMKYRRPPNSVQLLTVTKQQTPASIRLAYQAGVRNLGENYLQEALQKQEQLADLVDLAWHFIGPVQSNKTRAIAEHFQWIHSIDRIRIAERLSAQRPGELPALNCCVQINASAEASKSGVAFAEVAGLCHQVATLPHLNLRGLMAIPAPLTDFNAQRDCFHQIHEIFQQLRQQYPQMDTLSMGMSGDFEAAIAEGSTMIRLGTAIFGPRGAKSGSAE